jgi:hypothetical protein
MTLTGENRSSKVIAVPAWLCPLQTSHGLTCFRCRSLRSDRPMTNGLIHGTALRTMINVKYSFVSLSKHTDFRLWEGTNVPCLHVSSLPLLYVTSVHLSVFHPCLLFHTTTFTVLTSFSVAKYSYQKDQRAKFFCPQTVSRFFLCSEIIAVCPENSRKHRNSLCRQNAEYFNVNSVCTYSNN